MKRVLTVGPMPPEKCAYALARYSRSPDSIKDSIAWVRTHDSRKFLESFYFQYGHASIADLGHLVICFEGISEVAATEIEDEQLWDGQARSSRYQDFSKSGFITPPGLTEPEAELYAGGAGRLLEAYSEIHGVMADHLKGRLPRPAEMKLEAYERNIAARAYDIARYLLFLGVPTGVGQVVSIRTLERQIRRLKASEYPELHDLASELAAACAEPAACCWSEHEANEPIAPTLAKYVNVDEHARQSRADLATWAAQNLPLPSLTVDDVDLLRPSDAVADILATLLYPVSDRPYRELYDLAAGWSAERQREVFDVALRSRTQRDELLRQFRTATYVYDIVMDIGAYRDMHRHRRCQQFRQAYSFSLGFETPEEILEAGIADRFAAAMNAARGAYDGLPVAARSYIVPFGARARFLFKMDFAEAEYIARLRSGVKGHFSYRRIAWEMKRKMDALEPALGRLIEATPPSINDPLTR
jgi:thymidylate synthase ThyX